MTIAVKGCAAGPEALGGGGAFVDGVVEPTPTPHRVLAGGQFHLGAPKEDLRVAAFFRAARD
eukprot:3164264-Lingulodinium_polyedra.AAC.1